MVVSKGKVEFGTHNTPLPAAPQIHLNHPTDNVSFSYDDQTSTLHNISFKFPRGGRVTLVCESGAGKSTIMRLYRFYDLQPGSGRILIDGQDIRTVTLPSLLHAIGVVPQDPALFDASIE